jgi:ATP synthase protein I
MADDGQKRLVELDELDAKIRSVRQNISGPLKKSRRSEGASSLAGIAGRAGVELVAGVAVGSAVGYGLDSWLGTSPWMFILCFILGAAAGMLNVYRAVNGMGMSVGYKGQDPHHPPKQDK